jgi:hypothetical protein
MLLRTEHNQSRPSSQPLLSDEGFRNYRFDLEKGRGCEQMPIFMIRMDLLLWSRANYIWFKLKLGNSKIGVLTR